jgi:predicted dehydrogenase
MNDNAVIGMGYWGSIIYKNLKMMGFCPITYDIDISKCDVTKLEEINAKNVFICTPASKHFEYCSYFLKQGCNVFCEKPLTTNISDTKNLFNLATQYNTYLFVDWLFTFNDQVNYINNNFFIKHELGKCVNVTMNRLNKGPVRNDVNAIEDLASHDISILQLFAKNKYPLDIQWISYRKNNNSLQDDSCIGLLKYGITNVQINCSWQYPYKDRKCILEFDNGIVVWDDIYKTVYVNDKLIIDSSLYSPIYNSIYAFLNKTEKQNDIFNKTIMIERILKNEKCINFR